MAIYNDQAFFTNTSNIDTSSLDWTGGLYNQQWFPCSKGELFGNYFLSEQNGPLLKSLCPFWQRIGSPKLKVIQQIQQIYRNAGHCQDLPEDLMALAISQEKAIVKAICEALNSIPQKSITMSKPFEAFAGQLSLFSMVKVELMLLEKEVDIISNNEQEKLYQEVWRNQLVLFDKGRIYCQEQLFHFCLGDMIWGKAYRMPIDILQYSFSGYVTQIKESSKNKSRSLKGEPACSTISSSNSGTSISSHLGSVTSHTTDPYLGSMQTNSIGASSINGSFCKNQGVRAASQELLSCKITCQEEVFSSTSNRRGALAPMVCDAKIHELFDLPPLSDLTGFHLESDLAGAIQTNSPEAMGDIEEPNEEISTEAVKAVKEPMSRNKGEVTSTVWRTRLWTLSITSPCRTYSVEISPKGTTALLRSEGLRLPLRPLSPPCLQDMNGHSSVTYKEVLHAEDLYRSKENDIELLTQGEDKNNEKEDQRGQKGRNELKSPYRLRPKARRGKRKGGNIKAK